MSSSLSQSLLTFDGDGEPQRFAPSMAENELSAQVKSLNSEAIFKQLGANCTSHARKLWKLQCAVHFPLPEAQAWPQRVAAQHSSVPRAVEC